MVDAGSDADFCLLTFLLFLDFKMSPNDGLKNMQAIVYNLCVTLTTTLNI